MFSLPLKQFKVHANTKSLSNEKTKEHCFFFTFLLNNDLKESYIFAPSDMKIFRKHVLIKQLHLPMFLIPYNTYNGKDIFPRHFVNNGDKISSALVELGKRTSNKAVSMPGLLSVL